MSFPVSELPVILIFLCVFQQVLGGGIPATHSLADSFAISCGASGSSATQDGRVWIGDSGLESSPSMQINGEPSNSRAIHQPPSLDSDPYKTARASRHEFSYAFHVKPGQKFIRLHFYQDSYKGFKKSEALFTVKAGHYTLLSSLNTDVLGAKQIIKEYCVNIDEGLALTITFTPAQRRRKPDDFYAFVNGIEVVSMPTGLYFTPEGELGAVVVGQKYRFYIDNSTALELVRRLNVGGNSVSPAEDSRLFRRWEGDYNYLLEKGALPVNTLTTVRYREKLTYFAPIKVYQTARTMLADSQLGAATLTWKMPVNLEFRYLIRLHFSKFEQQITESSDKETESSDKEFFVLINNQIAEETANFLQRGGASGAAVHRDYIVMMDGDGMTGKNYLTIRFQPKFESRESKFHSTVVALELFKLSNFENSLDGTESVPVLQQQKKSKPSSRKNLISAVLTVLLALLNVAVYYLKRISESRFPRSIRSSSMDKCRQFSIEEIRASTNSFDPQFQIGSGGYGRVYKGTIDEGDTAVAIKRQKTESRQGENEFLTEIKMLSRVRHPHLVSLIGYCNDGEERILVYQYITKGTLSDHLYKANRHGRTNPHLPWELRLKVSIGAARGLYYLHSKRIIHRDVKSSNILLDENWIAKISDFGLSKMGPQNDSFTHVTSNIKGTFGYLDPEYFLTRKLTRKSDVYSFGVVLFEVLSGRPAVDIRLEEEQHSLAGWARYCIREGKVDRLIDHNLTEQISSACLKVFIGIAGRCLHTQPQGRPAMADVVMALELALALHTDPTKDVEEEENAGRMYSDHSDGVITMDDVNLPKGDSNRSSGEDNPSSSNQNNGKPKAKGSNTQRWWWDLFGIIPRTPPKPKALPLQPREAILFSFQEIQKATNNFHNSLIMGYGGLDYVYKGYIDGGKRTVAIRWSRASESRTSMAHELQSKKEIQMKSSPAQDYMATLIGYCETESDLILIYEHMSNGTLYDHLHDPSKDPLSWKQRLQICIGAAQCLIHIHSKVKLTMLHRHLKSTNIWLYENWVPKVSGWGLSKKKGNNQVLTTIRSNWNHLDSDYIRPEESTEKSYVYSFGLILFEVLFAEKESERWLEEDQVMLAQWIKSCMGKNLAGYIDPFLVGRAPQDSLNMYIDTAERCLLDYGIYRPSMADIVAKLEAALQLHESTEGKKEIQFQRS